MLEGSVLVDINRRNGVGLRVEQCLVVDLRQLKNLPLLAVELSPRVLNLLHHFFNGEGRSADAVLLFGFLFDTPRVAVHTLPFPELDLADLAIAEPQCGVVSRREVVDELEDGPLLGLLLRRRPLLSHELSRVVGAATVLAACFDVAGTDLGLRT